MKKLAILMVAAIVAVMFTAPAFAEDRLSLSGGYFARGWYTDTEIEYDDAEDTDTDTQYFRQRMRIQAKIKVADDVSATIRADLGEGIWGQNFTVGSVARPRNPSTSTIDLDRTYVTVNKEMWSLQVGQQYAGLGIGEVMDANMTGVNLGLKFDPVKINLIYAKIGEGGAVTDEDDLGTEDWDMYLANVSLALGMFDANFFGGTSIDDNAEDTRWAVGAHATAKFGVVNLETELAFLGGDNDIGDFDYTGTQFYVKLDSDITDMVNVGGEFVMALAADDDEAQISALTDWNSFSPMGINTPLAGWIGWSPFTHFGHAGVIGGTLFASATPVEKLSLGGKVGFFTSEDDDITDGDCFAFNAWIAYTIASNTKLSLTYQYENDDYDSYEVTDQLAVLQLAVSF